MNRFQDIVKEGREYRVNLQKLVADIEESCICRLLSSRYSADHIRVYQLFRSKSQISDDELIARCLLPKMRVVEIAESFIKDGIIHEAQSNRENEGAHEYFIVSESVLKEKFVKLLYSTLAHVYRNKRQYDDNHTFDSLSNELAESLMILTLF